MQQLTYLLTDTSTLTHRTHPHAPARGMHACMYVCMYACMHVCISARGIEVGEKGLSLYSQTGDVALSELHVQGGTGRGAGAVYVCVCCFGGGGGGTLD